MGSAIVSMKEFRGDMEKLRPQFAMALPRGFDEGRMIRMCITAVQHNPRLLTCTKESVYGSMMTAAQLGLFPDVSVLGHAYFIPFKVHGTMTCTFIVGYKGLIDLARRSGHVTSIMAYPVHEGDEFKFAYGTSPFIEHVPSREPMDERELTHVYGMANLRGEKRPQFVVMSREEVEAIRKRAPGRNKGPWVEHYEQMALKTVIRRLCKYLPLSSQLQRAVSLDEAADTGVPQNIGTAVDLDAMGAEVIEGEVVEDEDTISSTDSLDELLENMAGDGGPSPYEQLCIQGMEVFGDDKWKVKLKAAKKKVIDSEMKSMGTNDVTEALMDEISTIIRKGA